MPAPDDPFLFVESGHRVLPAPPDQEPYHSHFDSTDVERLRYESLEAGYALYEFELEDLFDSLDGN